MKFVKENLLGLLMVLAGAAFLLLGIVDNWLYSNLFEFGLMFEIMGESFWMGLAMICKFLAFLGACALVVIGALYLFRVLKDAKIGKIVFLCTIGAIALMMLSSIMIGGNWAMLIAILALVACAVFAIRAK